jgi:hypothetical protein
MPMQVELLSQRSEESNVSGAWNGSTSVNYPELLVQYDARPFRKSTSDGSLIWLRRRTRARGLRSKGGICAP